MGRVTSGDRLSNAAYSLKYASARRKIEHGLRVGLLIGRFQPFHNGHLSAVRYALEQVDYLYIAVGSAQRSYERDNPFTAGERISMIKLALDANGVPPSKWMTIPIQDAESHSVWVSSVKSMVPAFDMVFTNDSLTFTLFKAEGIEVKAVPYLDRKQYSATNVRNRILERKDWESLVPREVAAVVKKLGGVERVRSLLIEDLGGS
jgi:nicotinamide-nucleotide adenylyltransferase